MSQDSIFIFNRKHSDISNDRCIYSESPSCYVTYISQQTCFVCSPWPLPAMNLSRPLPCQQCVARTYHYGNYRVFYLSRVLARLTYSRSQTIICKQNIVFYLARCKYLLRNSANDATSVWHCTNNDVSKYVSLITLFHIK